MTHEINMLLYLKRNQKAWALITQARNLLTAKSNHCGKSIELLQCAVDLLEDNLDLNDDSLENEQTLGCDNIEEDDLYNTLI